MPDSPTPDSPMPGRPADAPTTVPARRFWVLVPVALLVFVLFAFVWPDAPGAVRALVGTAALIVTATVVVLVDNRRRST
jgi:hypothetical protein